MKQEIPIKFVKEKIKEIQTALFFPENNSFGKFQSHLISAETDEEGQVSFEVSLPIQTENQELSSFPCRLEFYKKGVAFYLQVQGQAVINSTITENKMNLSNKKGNHGIQKVSVKVKIEQINFQKIPPENTNDKFKESKSLLMNWLFKPKTTQKPDFLFKPLANSGISHNLN